MSAFAMDHVLTAALEPLDICIFGDTFLSGMKCFRPKEKRTLQ